MAIFTPIMGLSFATAVVAFAMGVSAQSYPQPANPGMAGSNPGMGRMDTSDAMHSSTAQKETDKDFVRQMIMGNHSEIDAGNLAVQKASNEEVKKFGQKMVDDHTMLLDDLTRLAEELQIKAPQAASSKDKAMAAKLSAMSGDAFDRAYVKDMVKDHEKDVAEVKKEANSAAIPEVKDAATKALPVIQGHLEMIQGIQKNMMAGGRASTR